MSITSLIVTPVLAQAGSACTTSGLFSAVTNFINHLFSTVTFGGVGGGTLSILVCQVVGLLTIALLLFFIAVLIYVAFNVYRLS